jgi:uncharacterized membrane protein
MSDVTDAAEPQTVIDEPDGDTSTSWKVRTAVVMVLAAGIGLAASVSLSIDAWLLAKDSEAQLACDMSQVVSCSAVARSWQAQILGFPNAFLGIAFESVVLTLSVAHLARVRFPRWFVVGSEIFVTGGLLFALWLFQQSYFVIHVLCPWCLSITSTTMILWAGATRIAVRDGDLPAGRSLRRFVASGADWFVVVGLLVVLVTMIVVRYGAGLLLS